MLFMLLYYTKYKIPAQENKITIFTMEPFDHFGWLTTRLKNIVMNDYVLHTDCQIGIYKLIWYEIFVQI